MYIDTSCIVAFIVPEPKTDLVNSKMVDAGSAGISNLTQVEFISAINKKVRMQIMTNKEASIAVAEFERLVSQGYLRTITFGSNHFERASFILKTTSLPLRTLDALHLSICSIEKHYLFTFDEIFTQAAQEFGIPVVDYESG